jgi:hypothetical protein
MRTHLLAPLALAACSSSTPAMMGYQPLDPPAAGQGVQYRLTTTVKAGEEFERCQFFTVPAGGLAVNRVQTRYTPGSHHVLLYITRYQSIPTKDLAGDTVDTSGVFDCSAGSIGLWDVSGVAAGAQVPDSPELDMPDGVGLLFDSGAVVLMNVHYLNASPKDIDADARINLYSEPRDNVKQEAGAMILYNPFIRVPASGTSRARMRCPVSHDVTLVNAQSHMHRRGVGFEADLVDAQGKVLDVLYQLNSWDNVPIKVWNPGMVLPAGTFVDYHCDYNNTEDHVVAQGFTTKDEMCAFVAAYYPRNVDFEQCNPDGAGPDAFDSAATWVGSGALTCGDVLTCLQKANGDLATTYGCVVDSCPSDAATMSAVFDCQMRNANATGGACVTACAGTDQSGCQSCFLQHCQSEIGACLGASCN